MITEYALGIDLGASKIAAGLVSRRGDILCGATMPTPPGQGADAILAAVHALGNEVNVRGRAEGLSIVATGMGAAGQIDYPSGRVRYAGATIPNWAGTELVEALQSMFGLPAAADNDVNVLALAEHRFGAARGFDHVLFVAVGTGVGGALILDGQVWRGRTCTAGEIAHVLVDWQGGRLCNCGQPGHLEAYAAGPAMAARYAELAGQSAACDLREVHALARAGDVQAKAAIAEGATILGKALCGLVDTLDLDAIVIGGGVPALGELWWEPLMAILRANPMPGPREIPVQPAALGVDAGIVGAGILALEQHQD